MRDHSSNPNFGFAHVDILSKRFVVRPPEHSYEAAKLARPSERTGANRLSLCEHRLTGDRVRQNEFARSEDELQVIRDIAPQDQMFDCNEAGYFEVGLSALRCINGALGKTKPNRILDLPCGYGRVTRVLRAAFPASEITVCDIQREAVDFCAEKFEATPIYSSEDPRRIELGKYDLIWCGSLLTHVDAERWEQFLALFRSSIASGGILVLTTNGRRVAELLRSGHISPNGWLGSEPALQLLRDFDRHGFGYQEYPAKDQDFPGQKSRYGWTIAQPWWVVRRLSAYNWRLTGFHEATWAGLQDVASVLRRPIDRVPMTPIGASAG